MQQDSIFFHIKLSNQKNIKLVSIVEGAVRPMFSYVVDANVTW